MAFDPDVGDPQIVGARRKPQHRASLDSERGHEVAQSLVDQGVRLVIADLRGAQEHFQRELIELGQAPIFVVVAGDGRNQGGLAAGAGHRGLPAFP